MWNCCAPQVRLLISTGTTPVSHGAPVDDWNLLQLLRQVASNLRSNVIVQVCNFYGSVTQHQQVYISSQSPVQQLSLINLTRACITVRNYFFNIFSTLMLDHLSHILISCIMQDSNNNFFALFDSCRVHEFCWNRENHETFSSVKIIVKFCIVIVVTLWKHSILRVAYTALSASCNFL